MNYINKALKTYREKGPCELSRVTLRFFSTRLSNEKQLKYRTYKTHLFNKWKFDTVAPPFQPISVEVSEVNWCTSKVSISKTLGQIRGGNWDQPQELTPIEEFWIVKGLKEKFQEEENWKNTAYVRYVKETRFDKGKSIWGATNTEEFIEKRCEYVESIYQDIIRNGYQPEHNPNRNKKYDYRKRYYQKLEPLIVIGRDGKIIWRDGFHRYTLAKVADVEEIPAQVVCRHKQWQELRDNIQKNGLPEDSEDLCDHPDLQDILK